MRRVVVTGLGLVTPLATGVKGTWSRLINAESGAGRITRFDRDDLPCKIAAEVKLAEAYPDRTDAFRADDWMEPKERKRVDDFILYGMAAAVQAVEDSGWKPQAVSMQSRARAIAPLATAFMPPPH